MAEKIRGDKKGVGSAGEGLLWQMARGGGGGRGQVILEVIQKARTNPFSAINMQLDRISIKLNVAIWLQSGETDNK